MTLLNDKVSNEHEQTFFFRNSNIKATQIDMADLKCYLPEILDQLQLLAKSGHK